jgi:hypothetical protein
MTVAAYAEPFVGTDHDLFTAWARETRRYRVERSYDKPSVALYDGNWVFRGRVYGEIAGSMALEVNESGLIKLRLPIDVNDKRRTWAAFWCLDQDARGTANIHIIVETVGARIGGRMKPKSGVKVRRSKDGDEVSIEFLEDTEELKFVHTAGNPFLPLNLIQQPKAWMLFMQADDALRLTLVCNLIRNQLTNISIANILGLLNPANWTIDNLLNLFGIWNQSQIVVVPKAIGTSVEPFALAVGSIRTSFFDVAAPILEDAELQMVTRRYLTGDPEPFPGAGTAWRNGTLFVDFVNKSGYRSGTSLGGNLLTGLTRTIGSLTANNVEDSYNLFTGAQYDTNQFRLPAWLATPPADPYVVYVDGDFTGIQESEFAISPGGACRITAGGQSMPGVNEIIKAFVEYGGDVLGDNLNIALSAIAGVDVTVGSLGGALNAFLEPIYKDSILAYNSVPLILRAAAQGWGHYLETASTNVTQAFTAASVTDLRARRRETDPGTEFTLKIANCTPWIIGDNGFGHYWLGDRVGGTNKYLLPHVYTRRCRSLNFDWDKEGLKIEGSFGDKRKEKDLFDRIAELTTKAATGLTQIGLL